MATSTATDGSDQETLALQTLLDIVKTASSAESWEAQNILLRRLALQGDVITSRVPAPRNITEIGGYLNLLAKLNEQEMRQQTLAGILGVAGPNPPLGWVPNQPPISMIPMTNDRPGGGGQSAIPLSFAVRSDFAAAVKAALDTLHAQGGQLPILSAIKYLPPASSGAPAPETVLEYLGRVLQVVPATALHDADSDPVVLARATGTANEFQIMARSIGAGGNPPPVAAQNWDVVKCTEAACAPVAVNASFIAVAPVLATCGFYPESPLPQPTNVISSDWSRFTNVTGLVAGVTRLVDELSLLYRSPEIQASAFAPQLTWVWDGKKFGPPM